MKTQRLYNLNGDVELSSMFTQNWEGVVVAELIAHPPPIQANRVHSPAGQLPAPRMWESCRTMPLAGGPSRRSPPSPQCGAAPYLTPFALIGS
ncbi:hypothetical protein PR048_023891 [Dryococelus australis]|uniref:Uncharacterized protein n=1 Tax=Dryococelus australis TaxID=614101 RepID=A0ABQ9GVB5_9NEOP|nr:hypothetical protein PR048_023891 [Dryococelus australis]